MARMAYAMNDYPDALAQQHRALLISERCNGIDHHETISDYVSLFLIFIMRFLTHLRLKFSGRGHFRVQSRGHISFLFNQKKFLD